MKKNEETQFEFRNFLDRGDTLFNLLLYLFYKLRHSLRSSSASEDCHRPTKGGINDKDIQIFIYFYWNQRTYVKVEDQLNDQLEIRWLFLTYNLKTSSSKPSRILRWKSELTMRISKLEVEIRINGEYISKFLYADDTVLLVVSLGVLQLLTDREDIRPRLNIRKTKFMTIRCPNSDLWALLVKNEEIERVYKFVYIWTTFNGKTLKRTDLES